MSKAFVRESDTEEDLPDEPEVQPAGRKNYMTPKGFRDLQDEFKHLMRVERRKVVEVVSWAAGNGDRSENGDYIYGKKRLREIDRRIRFLTKRMESAEVVDPTQQKNRGRVFFGATVTYLNERDEEASVTIVGEDEANMAAGKISIASPMALALLRAGVGDEVTVRTPAGPASVEITAIRYPSAG